jgi:hypothetical protein
MAHSAQEPFMPNVRTAPTSIRLPADLKSWIEARSILTDRSTNAAIVELLRDRMTVDPLTEIRVVPDRGRYVVASAFTTETFAAFAMKEAALGHALNGLIAVGANPSNIIDESTQEAA